MEVSQTYYYEVVTGDNVVVCITSDAVEAVRALPVGGEINEVVKIVAQSGDRTTILFVKDVVELR